MGCDPPGCASSVLAYRSGTEEQIFLSLCAFGALMMGAVAVQHSHETEYRVTASFLQIYMESIHDLLDPKKTNLVIRFAPIPAFLSRLVVLTTILLQRGHATWCLCGRPFTDPREECR
jgi:hypothetical protein